MQAKAVSAERVEKGNTLFLLMEQEVDRMGGKAGMNILSIYKSREDCETVTKEHKNKGQSKWGFKIPENHEFVVVEVPREITFGCEMPSWAEEMKNIQSALENIMSDMDKEESPKESQTAEE
jgi:hypothetical protein